MAIFEAFADRIQLLVVALVLVGLSMGVVLIAYPWWHGRGAALRNASAVLKSDLRNLAAASEAEIAGVTVAKMGGSYLEFAYEELQAEGDDRRFRPRIGLATDFPDESDTELFMRDMITVTPLLFDWTAYSVLDQLGGGH